LGHHLFEGPMQIPRRFLPLTLALASACTPAHVVTTPAPAPVAGARIRYALTSDTSDFATARVVSLDPERLVFERFIPGDPWGHWRPDSLGTDSLARLQVWVGRRDNAGRGAVIGGAIGAALGIACAADYDAEKWFSPTPEQCLLSGTLTGAGIGLLIGALRRSDVWAPTPLPRREPEQPLTPAPPPVSVAPLGVGIRVPLRLPIH
jgi:hypothetical protein